MPIMYGQQTGSIVVKSPPPEYHRIDSIINHGPRKNIIGSGINVIGVVSDVMPVSATNGTCFQLTFTIHDYGLNTNGIRVKFFKDTPGEMPQVKRIGDIVILRAVKIQVYRDELMGISSSWTHSIVFPRDVSIEQGQNSSKSKTTPLRFTRSKGADHPTMGELEWVVHLQRMSCHHKESEVNALELSLMNNSTKDKMTVPLVQSVGNDAIEMETFPSHALNRHDEKPVISVAKSSRKKFSLLKDVKCGEFYDIACEILQTFPNSFGSSIDVYVTDYTSNVLFPTLSIDSKNLHGTQNSSLTGQMTLKVELHPPHAQWAYNNIQIGDSVMLRNVRIKRSNGGLVEANIWAEKFHPDRVNVIKMEEQWIEHQELKRRKHTIMGRIESHQAGDAMNSDDRSTKKESKSERKKRRKIAQQEIEAKTATTKERYEKPDKSDNEIIFRKRDNDLSDSDSIGSSPKKNFSRKEKFNTRGNLYLPAPALFSLTRPVKCMHTNAARLSSFNELIYNPQRVAKFLKSNESFDLPFINVKHLLEVRVIDYFPHNIRYFAREYRDILNPSRTTWQWHFWLVLCAANARSTDAKTINVCVGGQSASDLLDEDPVDLSASPRTLQRLKSTLWTLWGDLAEQKEKFLTAHPKIQDDEHFTAAKHNIIPDNVPFRCCIAEYGIPLVSPVSDSDQTSNQIIMSIDRAKMGWERVWRLCDTRICH